MRPLHDYVDPATADELPRPFLEQRLNRESRARREAENLLESKSRELFDANLALTKTARALESQRVELNAIFEHALAGIVLAQEDLTIIRANRAASAMFALTEEDFYRSLSVRDLLKGTKSAYVWIEERLRSPKDGDESVHEAIAQRRDGTAFPVEFAIALLPLQGKNRSVWVFRDITKRREEEKRRANLERDLAQAQKLESLGTLASGVAHEINTPIQYVSDNARFLDKAFEGFRSVMAKMDALAAQAAAANFAPELCAVIAEAKKAADLDYLLEEAQPSIEQSLQGLMQVASIVKAIKEFSHPGGDAKKPVDLNQSITTTMTVLRNHYKYVANAEMDLAPDLPLILGHQGDLNQVLLNLIMNAADAIKERGAEEMGLIRVGSRASADRVEIRIEDNGCGIAPENLARIYDPFFTTKEVGRGSGQGLAISYNIIRQKHGGSILCESEPGKGTVFTLSLPIDDAAAATAGEAQTSEEASR